QNLAMLCSEAQFNFYLLHKSLAADRDQLRPARLVELLLRSILLRPIHDAPFHVGITMGDVPDEAGHEMTIGARHSFFGLRACFSLLKR
ncbi:MAG TPA: hypothetical protein VKM94_10495, partial [Blastocatellia bacterium]|nr:hypothetical protein [Blastocatellia bacterium]